MNQFCVEKVSIWKAYEHQQSNQSMIHQVQDFIMTCFIIIIQNIFSHFYIVFFNTIVMCTSYIGILILSCIFFNKHKVMRGIVMCGLYDYCVLMIISVIHMKYHLEDINTHCNVRAQNSFIQRTMNKLHRLLLQP